MAEIIEVTIVLPAMSWWNRSAVSGAPEICGCLQVTTAIQEYEKRRHRSREA